MNSALIIPLILYLLAIFITAFLLRRKHTDSQGFLQEYLIGNRSFGGFVLSMTLVSSYTSASTFIGGPGAAYKIGLGWVLLAMIQIPAAWLTLGVLGKKFAIEARRHHAITLNDMLYAQYKSRTVVILSAIALLLTFFATMVVQFIGAARLLQTVTGLSYIQGLMIFALTIGIYTTIGGFRAVVTTDAIQGIIMVIGTIALMAGIIHFGGGISPLITQLYNIDPGLITPYGPDQFLNQPFMLSFWVLVCFGVMGLPYTAIRCMSYKNSKSLHKAIIISTIVVSLLMLGMHLAGALGRAIVPDINNPDQIMPTLMMTVLPPVIAGIFLAGPMAAIMSSVDSQLIQASATLLKDLYINYINPKAITQPDAQKSLPRLSHRITCLLTLLVVLGALHPPEMIIWLNLLAFGAMQAVFLWPLVMGLYWEKASAFGALSSMITGFFCYAALSTLKPDLGGVHAIVPTLLLSLLAFIVGSLLKPNSREKIKEIQCA
ncbi:Sodium/pantothenate symporter [invertebrate metagenome]|uniref:Sodium/pantothenate symporter n=1 Tax=invertebrate metagenome TaxID=1711999 RepID=A0A2H9T487_9ZZZZ